MKLTSHHRALGLGAALLLLGAQPAARAQGPATCITTPDVVSGQPTWNWEAGLFDPSYRKTWSAYTYSSGVGSNSAVVMGAPWYTNNTEQIAQIAATRDYTKAKGWRLLRVNFGCTAAEEHPWFVLYNQYTGVLRVFVWLNNLNTMNQGAMISLKQVGSRITAVGSNSSLLLNAPDYYLSNSVPTGSDYVSVLVTTAGSVKWASADFQMTLDPNSANSVFAGSELVFEIHGITSSNVDLAGKFKFTTDQATPAISGKPTAVSGQNNTFVVDTKKVIAKINNGVKGAQGALNTIHKGAVALAEYTFKGAYQAPGARENMKKYYYDVASDLADFSAPASATTDGSELQRLLAKILKVGTGAAGAIPGLSFLGPILGLVFPSDETPASIPYTPTISMGDISLTGTIETKAAQNSLRIQIPGTVHNNNTPTTLPYYNCALGVFNISNTPVLQKSTPQRYIVESGTTMRDMDNGNWVFFEHGLEISTYKVDNDLNPVFNTAAGLTPISVEGAIVFRRANEPSDNRNGLMGNASTDLLADPYTANELDHHITFSQNPLLPEFEARNLLVNKMVEKNLEFQTPFVSLACLKSVTARAPSDAQAFVRVRAFFRRNDAPLEPPMVIVYDYAVRQVPNAAITHAYPVAGVPDATWPVAQPGSGYRTLAIRGTDSAPILFGPGQGSSGNNLVIRSSESIEVSGAVAMPVGTTLGLTTDFQPISCTSAALATAVSGTGCEAYAQTWWRAEKAPDANEQPRATKAAAANEQPRATKAAAALDVFPNPNSGSFSVQPRLALGEAFSLSVYNFMGQKVYSHDYTYHGQPIPVTIEALRAGVYVVKVTTPKAGVLTAALKVE